MKLNKIISTALLVAMMFTLVIAAVPFTASAAYTQDGTEASSILTPDEVTEYVKGVYGGTHNDSIKGYQFNSAEEMLEHEKSLGYLSEMSSKDKKFTMYVNGYTGCLYYVNNVTGQVLTSNPYYYDDTLTEVEKFRLASQIHISFSEISSNSPASDYYSTQWAALRSQITTEFISGGIRVNYTLGDTTSRYLLPGRILADKYEEMILVPAIKSFVDAMEAYCADENYNGEYDVFTASKYNAERDVESNLYRYGYINSRCLKNYYLSDMEKIYTSKYKQNDAEYKELNTIRKNIISLLGAYTIKNLAEYKEGTSLYESTYSYYVAPLGSGLKAEVFETLEPMYVLASGKPNSWKSSTSTLFRKYADSYTIADMFEDEKYCGHIDDTAQKPVFRCAIEYTFADDGSLQVRLPASSISFDQTVYILESITPLQFFGSGDLREDGYLFFPDGSGMVLEFEDVETNAVIKNTIYGADFCYSELNGLVGAHREQITMPVFGLVNDDDATATTQDKFGVDRITNGFLAIVEQGSSLAELKFECTPNTYRGSVYCMYKPYPSDKYDLSETLSVGGNSDYTIVSESKYNGSYVTRYVMLTDDAIGQIMGEDYNSASYVGMAKYYREYLYKNGDLKALAAATENLPLYIEALGSMEIVTKFLSFPVERQIPLTTFDDVLKMYERFSSEGGITDINFRLNGFGNGGLHSTYPTKLRWDKACGGKRAYKRLLKEAKAISKNTGSNFGIYPEYDFMFIHNTASFDGIGKKKDVSRMIDNRYASQQVYDSIIQEFTTYYSMVVNPESYDKLYSKFIKKYSRYGNTNISVSTLGYNLNSNFDKDAPVNRDEAASYVAGILERMAIEDEMNIMIDAGNVYAIKYATHILNVSINSSNFNHSSYSIPFVGMILHGSVNYAGAPLNYSGTPAYDILRSIESGAALYYILCYQTDNISYMKEDFNLNKYYGVDYDTWYDNIVESYKEINSAIGGLQNYYITDHKIIKGERVIALAEQQENYKTLLLELVDILNVNAEAAVKAANEELTQNGSDYNKNIRIVFDRDALMAQFSDILNLPVAEIDSFVLDGEKTFGNMVDALIKEYVDFLPTVDDNDYIVNVSSVEYNSKYSFITESLATDENYVYTDFTSDIGNIVLVTYSNGTDTVQFVLNYNVYAVTVNLGGSEPIHLEKNSWKPVG